MTFIIYLHWPRPEQQFVGKCPRYLLPLRGFVVSPPRSTEIDGANATLQPVHTFTLLLTVSMVTLCIICHHTHCTCAPQGSGKWNICTTGGSKHKKMWLHESLFIRRLWITQTQSDPSINFFLDSKFLENSTSTWSTLVNSVGVVGSQPFLVLW